MISIGVLSVGLLGVVLLIPIAQHKAVQGTLEDRKAIVGRRAYREFRVRGMNRPTEWRFFDGTNWQIPMVAFGTELRLPYQAHCIDPDLIAEVGGGPLTFPSTATLPMPSVRYTLQGVPNGPMVVSHAREVFRFRDDLVFEPLSTLEPPPQQKTLNAGDGTPLKRFAEGHFSWMATLFPADESFELAGQADGADNYVFSAVIFHKRVMNAAAEISVLVPAQPTSTNSVEIDATAHPSFEVFQKGLRVGNWLLLAQPDTAFPNDPKRRRFRWVRVIAANDGTSAGSATTRLITHDGVWDWSIATEVTYIPGIVSVYEKPIRLENTTVWNLP